MSDPRPRHAGRRSPTVNPARASMPVNIGYNLPYTGELHAIPPARYDGAAPRRHEPKAATGPNQAATAIATYNAAADPMSRSLSRSNRNRSSTVDSHAAKPIIVTTNHPRPHPNPSHASGSVRASSPPREPHRPDDGYYAVQPASSIRSRSHNRHSYNQGAPLGDEFYRLRERVGGAGDDRLWGPARTSTDNFRNPRPHVLYTTPAHPAAPAHHAAPAYGNGPAVVDYEDDYYEYTKPGELVRYDLDHDRERRSRRDSVDRPYYRPHVNVVNHDTSRYEPRNRGRPPPSAGLERYNRAAAAGAYDRPSVTMPAPPAVPPPPPIDSTRRPALLEESRSPSSERRATRARPVSLYQDGPARLSHADDLYRSRDDERVGKDRRERDDGYRDENVTVRGFGIRTDSLDQQQIRSQSALPVQNYEERRPRREVGDRDSKRTSDESLIYVRTHDRDTTEGNQPRTEEGRDRKNGVGRRESLSRTREKAIAGGKMAAAGAGLVPVVGRYDGKVSPRREALDEERDYGSRVGQANQSRERETSDRGPSSRTDSIASEKRQELREERLGSNSGPEDRAAEDVKDRNEHAETKLETTSNRRDASPENSSNQGRRRHRSSPAFDTTDTKESVDLEVEPTTLDNQNKATETANETDMTSTKETASTNDMPGADISDGSDKGDDSVSESRGREVVVREEKQVRLVSPPRDKSEQKPIKGILKTPSARFPEDANPIREGVAPHKDDQTKKDVPPGARWTKISRKKVNPEALTIGKERFEVRDDFVIVLRVLNKEEIQAYATETARLRDKRRKEFERESKNARNSDEEQTRSDEERQRRHRHRREREDDEYQRGRVADDRHRRQKPDDESESRRKAIEYHQDHYHHRQYDSNAEDRR
ncbi:hypothetical protein F4861DRAFT_522956 [Xylaria intraflava]|nr:hypothetical protein F4861DRAFT_522956 [Xylaria intraflava]